MDELNSDGGVVGDPVKNNSRVVEQREVSPQQSGRTSSEERPTLLVRLKEGDGVLLQWVEPESGDNFLYRALTSQTYFVTEEEGSSVDGERKDYGGSGEGLDPNALANLNALVGEVVKDVGVDGGHNQAEETTNVHEGQHGETEGKGISEGVGFEGTDVEAAKTEGVDVQSSDGDETEDEEGRPGESEGGLGDPTIEEDARNTEDGKPGETEGGGGSERRGGRKKNRAGVVYMFIDAQVDVFDGFGEDLTDEEPSTGKTVLDVSHKSDGGVTARHEPVEQEGELAAVLLAKDQYMVPEIIPLVEDCDYAFFERVLMANLKVLHINARGYDLENEFFINLATTCKWVTSMHMDILIEYLGSLHAKTLRTNRAMFVAPWFSAHLQGKGRSFRATRRKTLVATDSRVTKFLTTEGKQWGVDVDTLYAPMIWDGNHWVGLCIRLTTWDVLVLDPRPGLKSVEEVAILLAPVAEMLPYLAKKVCPPHAIVEHQLVPFHVERVVGLYENLCSGNCGPVAAKFMEIHATREAIPRMAGLTDDLVDIYRKQYAMEIYRYWVLPLYM